MTVRASEIAVVGARRILPALALLALVFGVVLLFSSFGVTFDAGKRSYGAFIVGLAGALVAIRVADFLVFDVGYRIKRGTAAPDLLRQIVSLLLFALALGILFQVALSASLPALLATSAVITAVVGLALQETLGNLFSGVALALERTVQVGDMVRSGETIGLVEQLSWRSIKVRTMEGHTILIPNSVASRERFEVYRRGGLPMARILRVSLEYDLAPAHALSVLVEALRDTPGLAPHPAPSAQLHAFDNFAVVYELRYWLDDYARYIEIDSEVRQRVWYALSRESIGFAYPVIRQHQYAAGPLPRPDVSRAVVAAIEASPLFAPLSAEERARLAAGARLLSFGQKETVVREGEDGSSMFLIARGRVGVSAHGASSESQRVAMLDEGSGFGEISLLTGEPRLATIRTLEESLLVEIDKSTLAPILEANPSLVDKLDDIVLERRRQTSGQLEKIRGSGMGESPVSLRAKIARFFDLKGLA
ncbi:MAG: mechanosensitive ion channel family protein [Thermoanaerobaculia bacterium]